VVDKATHLPGGNRFDDVRIDLPASFAAQDLWLSNVTKASARSSYMRTALRRAGHRMEPYRVREALVNAGLRRMWFEEFREYWESVLEGRPLTVMDFHNLRFLYRTRAQYAAGQALAWDSSEQHLANWQQPQHLFQTFDFVYRSALHPVWGGGLLAGLLRPGARVLEYGCGLAPMYRTWRTFRGHVPTHWLLADIPGHAFHYARHVFGPDEEASFAVVDDLANPLADDVEPFDLIIVQTVFEHLDRPRFVAERLVEHLRPGGRFWFDYILSGGAGLDTPVGLAERRSTLEYLAGQLDVVHGELRIDDRSLGTCVGVKRGTA
jgi:SAM-dependent methyltransferase